MSAPLTAESVRSQFIYVPETGFIYRRMWRGKPLAEPVRVGTPHSQGYEVVSIGRRPVLSHRLAWLYHYGRWPADQVDHINGNRRDNRICNLREATNAQNCQNVRAHRDASSRHVGVCLDHRHKSKPWRAQICVGGKQRVIGQFATEAEAVAARVQAKAALHRFHPVQEAA